MVEGERKLSPMGPVYHDGPLIKRAKRGSSTSATFRTDVGSPLISTTQMHNHRPVTSCTHCRQHKIRCDASNRFPAPCTRCVKSRLHCEINPDFKPTKGSQVQLLRQDLDELKTRVDYLFRNDGILAQLLNKIPEGREFLAKATNGSPSSYFTNTTDLDQKVSVKSLSGSGKSFLTYPIDSPDIGNDVNGNTYSLTTKRRTTSAVPAVATDSSIAINDTNPRASSLNLAWQKNPSVTNSPSSWNDGSPASSETKLSINTNQGTERNPDFSFETARDKKSPEHVLNSSMAQKLNPNIEEFVLEDVRLPLAIANELHEVFVKKYLPYFPIIQTNSATELYSQSQLLFWTTMLTACLSDPEPTMYLKLASLIKQLAIETCWLHTPRSTHISQALLILCIWPLPNQKVIDDCSYRFVGLAKSLSFQLGLHRGEFISEFTRTQTSMPDAEKWRTRTWLGIFFAELCWASILGLPPTSKADYLVKHSLEAPDVTVINGHSNACDQNHHKLALPSRFKKLIGLANFQSKLCERMGSSDTSPDGLLEPVSRSKELDKLATDLSDMKGFLDLDSDPVVQIYSLYVELMIYCFGFLPETPLEEQCKYVPKAYNCATKIITLLTQMLSSQQLIELPIYVRHSATFAGLILFKLQLTPLLPEHNLNSARQSIVTLHRLYRNQFTAWATSVENDISRTASTLEKFNFVLITHPEVLIEEKGIISRMRSHLTGSLFYDLVWCVHEARRREMDVEYDRKARAKTAERQKGDRQEDSNITKRKLYPLPLYTEISREDFKTVTKTTPTGTTVTTLIPTKNALEQAKEKAKTNDQFGGDVIRINGIPITMLHETGSVGFGTLLDESVNINDPSITSDQHLNLNAVSSRYSESKIANNKEALRNGSVSSTDNVLQNNPEAYLTSDSRNRSKTSADVNDRPVKDKNSRLDSLDQSMFDRNFVTSGITNEVNGPTKDRNHSGKDIVEVKDSSDNVPKGGSPRSNNDTESIRVDHALLGSETANPRSKEDNKQNMDLLSDFLQQQSAGWIEGNSINDDFFGWFNLNMEQEF